MNLLNGTKIEIINTDNILQKVAFSSGPRVGKVDTIKTTFPDGSTLVTKVRYWYNESCELVNVT